MECNRDEALRAKSIAEGKLEKKDFAGAKKFALKAQTLYPGLDGISQMLTTLDVYVSAENKISGETDWYGVLGVTPSVDDETLRKQYRKLALSLHPDKNKSVCADGAFKLISEAWSLLSDKAKRLAYNQRRGFKGLQQKVQMNSGGGPSAQARRNGVFSFPNKAAASVPKSQNNVAKESSRAHPIPSDQRNDTFWTICQRCKMHYEYLKIYLNNTLLCPNCNEAFIASETDPPYNFSKSSNQERVPSRNAFDPGRNIPVPKKSSGPCEASSNPFRHPHYQHDSLRTDPSVAAKAANVVQQAQDKLKRAYTESHSSAGWEGSFKQRKLDDDSSRFGMRFNTAQGNGGFGMGSGSLPGSRIYGFSTTCRSNSTRDLTPVETRKMLVVKARKEILNKLSNWRSDTTTAKAAAGKRKNTNQKSKKERSKSSTDSVDEKCDKNVNAPSVEDPADPLMSVPDPDFHDFDQDRAESSFGENEVWASYDDDDGMPRFYALISKVISRKPFKLKISWLNSKITTEFSTMDWVGSGFYKTCGEFRIGKYEPCKSINSFSQKVKWTKGPRGSILIFPQKNDVWALYKNWSSDWNEHTPDEVIHKYEMVTVLDDYNEEKGVCVAPLVKVVGFKTVFRPNLDQELIKKISKEEMFRFSHRVPYHLLTSAEAQDVPEGCLELDPAATPLELLQVITEGNEIPTVPEKENAEQEVKQCS
ncbi:hypothetical protein ACP275_06G023700 [Erythranthe tilingii]